MFWQAPRKYWLMQFLGWGLVHLLLMAQSFQALNTGQESLSRLLILSPLTYLFSIFASHLLYLWASRTNLTTTPFRESWRKLLSFIGLIGILMSTVFWFALKVLAVYLPPPASRADAIVRLFDNYLLFILNFTLVNILMLGLWWLCYQGLTRHYGPVHDDTEEETEASLGPDSPIMISDGKQSRLLTPRHIEYAYSEGNYVKVVGQDLNMLIRGTLSGLESKLVNARFFRANRHTLVNLMKVENLTDAVNGNLVLTLTSGKDVEISRRQGQLLRRKISL